MQDNTNFFRYQWPSLFDKYHFCQLINKKIIDLLKIKLGQVFMRAEEIQIL